MEPASIQLPEEDASRQFREAIETYSIARGIECGASGQGVARVHFVYNGSGSRQSRIARQLRIRGDVCHAIEALLA
jgi:hypothetical protein